MAMGTESKILTNEMIDRAYTGLTAEQKVEIDGLVKVFEDKLDERASARRVEAKLKGDPQMSNKVGLARIGALEVIAKLGIFLNHGGRKSTDKS